MYFGYDPLSSAILRLVAVQPRGSKVITIT